MTTQAKYFIRSAKRMRDKKTSTICVISGEIVVKRFKFETNSKTSLSKALMNARAWISERTE